MLPAAAIPQEELLALLEESERRLAAARNLDRQSWFEHFALGVLDRDKALRFLAIHNRHHAQIIADIVAARSRNPGPAE